MGYIDIHSHILPKVDDGAANMEETMEMLRLAQEEGITHIVVTPHYKSKQYLTLPEKLHDLLCEIQEKAEQADLHVTLYGGTEIFYNSGLEEKLSTGKLCTMNGTEYVLIEFFPFEEYRYIRNAMEELLGMGYTPILAHAERYGCMQKEINCIRELKTIGCKIQVNTGSVIGQDGRKAAKFVRQLLKEQLVDYLGTDAHGTKGHRKPAMEKCASYLYKKCDTAYAEALLHGNAERDLL